MTKRLIPVILLKNGFVVRSQTFTQHQKIGNLVSTVQRLSSWSVDELVVLNIGHQDNQSLNRHDLAIEYNAATDTELVKLISSSMFMPLSFGGGINSLEQIENLLNSGADKVVLNTAIINNPEMVKEGRHDLRIAMYRRQYRCENRRFRIPDIYLSGKSHQG